VCPTRYRTRHFFNNFTTNEDIATKFEADLPHCARNVKTSQHLLEVATICVQTGLNPACHILESPCQYVRCYWLNFSRWCLLSRRLWFVVCFGKLSLSDIPIRNNQTASDRVERSGQSPFEMTRSPTDRISAMLACEVWDVAQSCWKYPIQSSSSSNWFTKALKISICAAVVMVASKLGPIMRRDIPH